MTTYEDWTSFASYGFYTFYDFFFVRMQNAKIDDDPNTYNPETLNSMIQTVIVVDSVKITN